MNLLGWVGDVGVATNIFQKFVMVGVYQDTHITLEGVPEGSVSLCGCCKVLGRLP